MTNPVLQAIRALSTIADKGCTKSYSSDKLYTIAENLEVWFALNTQKIKDLDNHKAN